MNTPIFTVKLSLAIMLILCLVIDRENSREDGKMDRRDRFAFLSAEAVADKEHGLPGRARLGAGPVGIRTLRMPGGGVTKLMRVMQTNACSLSCGYCPTFCGGKGKRVRLAPEEGARPCIGGQRG